MTESERVAELNALKLRYITEKTHEYDNGSISAEKCVDLIVGMLCISNRPLTAEEKAYPLTLKGS